MRKTQRNNTSGFNGFSLVQRRNKGRGKPTLAVRAQWREDGRVRGTSFSVSVNGRLGATELAIRARHAGILREANRIGEPVEIVRPSAAQVWAAIRDSEPKAG